MIFKPIKEALKVVDYRYAEMEYKEEQVDVKYNEVKQQVEENDKEYMELDKAYEVFDNDNVHNFVDMDDIDEYVEAMADTDDVSEGRCLVYRNSDIPENDTPMLHSKRDLKYGVKEICDYALLEGKNTDWVSVVDSFGRLEEKYDSYMGFDCSDVDEDFCSKLEELIDSVSRGQMFGEDDGTIKFKLLLMADIYRNIEKWDIVNN